jgi:hypothetical protein
MTVHDETELRLRRAVAVNPSDEGLRWLDERLAAIVAQPASLRRRRVPSRRAFLRPLALAAAFVLLTGTVVATMGLLDRTVESSGVPAWRTAWNRGEVLNLRQTDRGVTVVLERAYVDLNQVMVGFTVDGLAPAPASGGGEPGPIEWTAQLRDPTGRPAEEWATGTLAMGVEETNLSAVLQTWDGAPAPVAGTWELIVTSVGYESGGMQPGECSVGATEPSCVNPQANGMIEGLWRFEFALPKPAGTVVSTDAADTAGPATLTMTELRVTPTMVSGRLVLAVAGSTVGYWAPLEASVRHDGESHVMSIVSARDPAEEDVPGNDNTFSTLAGSDRAAGTWKIEVAAIRYSSGDGAEIQLEGPWELTVVVP